MIGNYKYQDIMRILRPDKDTNYLNINKRRKIFSNLNVQQKIVNLYAD